MGDERKAGANLRDQAVEWLVALDCGTADVDAFEAWRNTNPRHASAFAQVAATWRRTAAPEIATLIDRPMPAEPQPTIEAETAEPPPARRMTRRAMAAGLATAIGIGGAGAFIAWPSRAYASTGVGERRTIPLPDGSHAMLNTDTRVSWRFGKAREFWIERGEAALLIRDGAAPFRLDSAPIGARLSGGSFNIRLDATGGRLLVLAGQAVTDGSGASRLPAGTMLTVRDGESLTSALPAETIDGVTAWQQGRIVFNGMPLDRALAEFNRYLPEKIVLKDPALAATPLGGTFRIDDPDSFLLALQAGFDIDHRAEDGHILLYSGRRS
jgi:transmembrane sensor